MPDFSSCRIIGRIPGNSEFLTVTTPLQLGGIAVSINTQYPVEIIGKKNFVGCIKELRIGGEVL